MLHHRSGDRLREEKGPLEIDVEDGIPVRFVHPHHQCVACDSGIVDEDIDVSEVGEDLLHACRHGASVAHVGGVRLGFTAELRHCFDGLGKPLLLYVAQSEVGALPGQFLSDGSPDSAGGARNDRHFSFEISFGHRSRIAGGGKGCQTVTDLTKGETSSLGSPSTCSWTSSSPGLVSLHTRPPSCRVGCTLPRSDRGSVVIFEAG